MRMQCRRGVGDWSGADIDVIDAQMEQVDYSARGKDK